jgi:hypothetical protein
MYDSEDTRHQLLVSLSEVGVNSRPYRQLLDAIIKNEPDAYNLAQAKARALALIKETYETIRTRAMAAGFSESFAITLGDMAMRPQADLRDDLYLYMMKSTKKRGLHRLTDEELAATDVYDVTEVSNTSYHYRIYGNLTDAGVDLIKSRMREVIATAGLTSYKFAKKGSRWRRDTMVIYCATEEATKQMLAWLRGLQQDQPKLSDYFASDTPHFTEKVPECQGISFVSDLDAGSRNGSHSQAMSELVKMAIENGQSETEDHGPTINSYVTGILDKLAYFWEWNMKGTPKP